MSDDVPPPGWCPECDGQSQCAPGPAPDRAAAELAEAEQQVRALARCRSNGGALEIVLAELDRQRELIAAVLAEVDAREQWAQPWQTAGLSCAEIRALLEGEER